MQMLQLTKMEKSVGTDVLTYQTWRVACQYIQMFSLTKHWGLLVGADVVVSLVKQYSELFAEDGDEGLLVLVINQTVIKHTE